MVRIKTTLRYFFCSLSKTIIQNSKLFFTDKNCGISQRKMQYSDYITKFTVIYFEAVNDQLEEQTPTKLMQVFFFFKKWSSYPSYTVTCYIKWVITSWTHYNVKFLGEILFH